MFHVAIGSAKSPGGSPPSGLCTHHAGRTRKRQPRRAGTGRFAITVGATPEYNRRMADVTQLFDAATAGDRQAAAELLPLVYDELRKLAAVRMTGEKPGHTLDATALVHEAYLRLIGYQSFESRSHFFRVASEAMRRILVDYARSRRAEKRGGDGKRLPLDDYARWAESPEELLDLDDALARFAAEEPRKAELVVLRFYAGQTTAEAAAALGISLPTAERWWAFARVWLFAELDGTKSEKG